MKIVDFHCHLAQGDWYFDRFLESIATLLSEFQSLALADKDLEDLLGGTARQLLGMKA